MAASEFSLFAKFYHLGLDKENFLIILIFTFSEFSLIEIIHQKRVFATGIKCKQGKEVGGLLT
ncbi:MAG: hypothetical protein CSB13_07830 [Chloroflexi bacterium]|nr:MAG: hypothetical protein CSB13_07830 [Chloroflexota bacterium]